jgi:hypothetical protein
MYDISRRRVKSGHSYANPWAGVAQQVRRLATGWKGRVSNPVGGQIFCTSPDRSGPTQPPAQWLPGVSRRYTGPCVALPTHPI